MSCCAPGAEGFAGGVLALPSDDEVRFSARDLGDGVFQSEFSVPAVHCGACIQSIETGIGKLAGVEAARVNLSTRRVTVRWRGDSLPPVVATLARLGYAPTASPPATSCCFRSRSGRGRKGRRATCSTGSRR
jgi:Cu2+-exporting ATPase